MESAEFLRHQDDGLTNFESRPTWISNRFLTTRHQQKTSNSFGARNYQYKFVGEVVDFDPATMTATIRQRNAILEGDHVESTDQLPSEFVILKTDANGNKNWPCTKPNGTCRAKLN